MARKRHVTKLPAPFLKRISLRPEIMTEKTGYPFSLPWLRDDDFELNFTQPVTIIVGENGVGKSTFIEAIAGSAGYDEAGGGRGYQTVDHTGARDTSASELSDALRLSWLPKIAHGWFFRAETFFSVARYLDAVGSPAADFLSHSHGEGFLRFFAERMAAQGIYFLDEPENALSPNRQMELLKVLHSIQQSARAQVVMATHSPILMALPGADLLRISADGFEPVGFRETMHFKLYQDFSADPEGFVADALRDVDRGLI